MSRFARPNPAEFGFFSRYIARAPQRDLPAFLESQAADLLGLLRDLPEAESLRHHAPYTWSIRQVIGHITDCERVFSFRALWIARGDATALPGFDENAFVHAADFDRQPLPDLLAEFHAVRQSSILMLRQFPQDAWNRRGTVSGLPMTPAAMACVIAGHAQHHLDIVHRRLERPA